MTINYRTADVSGIKIFYREAGSPSAPDLATAPRISEFQPHVP